MFFFINAIKILCVFYMLSDILLYMGRRKFSIK
jgi:hypothetical protein